MRANLRFFPGNAAFFRPLFVISQPESNGRLFRLYGIACKQSLPSLNRKVDL